MSYKEQKIPLGDPGTKYKNYEVILHNIGNQTDTENNNNKFFSIELWKVDSDWYVYTNYGRVDDKEYTGVAGLYGPDNETSMKEFFNDKWKEKSKKYKKIEFVKSKVGSPKSRDKIYEVATDDIPEEKKKKIEESKKSSSTIKIEKLDPIIERLVNQFYSESLSAITNNSAVTITKNGIETPLGVLSFSQIKTGREVLGELGSAVKSDNKDDIKKLTSNFYSIIPTKMGRKISESDLINTDSLIQIKIDLLSMMEDALELGATSYVSDAQTKYMNLGSLLEPIDHESTEFKRIVKKIKETKGSNHYGTTDKVLNILKVKNLADYSAFESCKIDNLHELFHGSRNCNISGILKRGLLIAPPEAPVSGYMFDKGVYTADASTKSINYSMYHFPGVEKSKNCFLFLTDVKLGKQLKLDYSDSYAAKTCKNGGYDSTMGVKGRSLIHNEFIVYKTEQVSLRYLVELQR